MLEAASMRESAGGGAQLSIVERGHSRCQMGWIALDEDGSLRDEWAGEGNMLVTAGSNQMLNALHRRGQPDGVQ